ncbi:MAG: hypothetical protein V1913_07825 [Fibrobacterota bacterium]
MDKRQSRFDRLREEKRKYPDLYAKISAPAGSAVAKKAAPGIKALSEKSTEAIANVLRLMMSEKKA